MFTQVQRQPRTSITKPTSVARTPRVAKPVADGLTRTVRPMKPVSTARVPRDASVVNAMKRRVVSQRARSY